MVHRHAKIEARVGVVLDHVFGVVRWFRTLVVAKGSAIAHDRKALWNPKHSVDTEPVKALGPLVPRLLLFLVRDLRSRSLGILFPLLPLVYDTPGYEDAVASWVLIHLVRVDFVCPVSLAS